MMAKKTANKHQSLEIWKLNIKKCLNELVSRPDEYVGIDAEVIEDIKNDLFDYCDRCHRFAGPRIHIMPTTGQQTVFVKKRSVLHAIPEQLQSGFSPQCYIRDYYTGDRNRAIGQMSN